MYDVTPCYSDEPCERASLLIRRVACVGFAERKRVVRYVVRVTTSRAAPESKQEIRFDSLMIEITVYLEIHVVSLLHAFTFCNYSMRGPIID